MHAWTRNLIATVAGGLLLAGCADKNAKPAARETITPPTAAQKPEVKAEDLPEAAPPSILPRTYLAAGRFHETQGHYARALEQYQQAVASDPKSVEALNRLGVVLDRMGRLKEADDTFKKAIAIAPQAAYLHNNLAFSYMTQGRWTEAEAELTQALKLKPDFPRARVNLGMVLAQQDKFDEAAAQFEQALSRADALYNVGLMYQSKRKLPEAARSFHLALQANPKLVSASKRLETLPPNAVKAGKEMATAVASPKPQAIVATATPATRPAIIEEPIQTPQPPELAKPVQAEAAVTVSDAAAPSEVVAVSEQGPTEKPAAEAATSVETADAAAEEDVEHADLASIEMQESAEAKPAGEPVPAVEESSVTTAEPATKPAEDAADEDEPAGAKDATDSEGNGDSSTATQPAEGATDESTEDTPANGAAMGDGQGLTRSLLAGVTGNLQTGRKMVARVAVAAEAAADYAIVAVRKADPYADFMRMASPLALEVSHPAPSARPFDLAENLGR